ncbi:MAG: DUF6502 family protein [Pseudomonadota bacterium]
MINQKHVLSAATIRILRALVRVLLRYGMPFDSFAELAKRVYIDVAQKDYSLPGRKQSISRISTLTGIYRREVSRLLELPEIDDSEITNSTTGFEGGAAEDIMVGVKLEAEGDFNTDTGILTADKIRFRETRTRIEAQVTVPAGGLGGSFTIMDVITVNTTPLTEDDDGLIDGSGASGGMQVEVRGFVDGNGTVIATRVRERGSADFNDVRLRGPIDNIVNPTFEILGVTVDTATATSIFDDTASPAQSINATTFFNRVSDGTPVQVEDGTFNSGPPFITGGDIEIED